MSYMQKVMRPNLYGSPPVAKSAARHVVVKLNNGVSSTQKAHDRAAIERIRPFVREGETPEARQSAASLLGTLTANYIRRYGERPA